MTDSKVLFEDFSWFDRNGRLIKSINDDNFVYRAISQDSFNIFIELYQNGFLTNLISTGLVDTQVADFSIIDYAAVLKHSRIPFISLPNEWTMRMFHEAAIIICKLAIELDKVGLGLQDSHPWNVSFNRTNAIYFDWGSLIRSDQVNIMSWLLEFRKQVYLPLLLYSKGFKTLAYESLWERRGGSAKYLFNHPKLRRFPLAYYSILKNCLNRPREVTLNNLSDLVNNLKISDNKGFWSDYDQDSYLYKEKAFSDFITSISPDSTILDFGCNKGAYSIKCSNFGHEVVAFDFDEKAINDLYDYVKVNNCSITPLRIDVMNPTPSYGPDLSYPDVFSRLKSDFVIAFAISHHLAKNYSLRFDTLSKLLYKYSFEGVLVEYIDLKDIHIQNWIKRGWTPPYWYSEKNFVSSFSRDFIIQKIWATTPEEQYVRKIFQLKKRDLVY